MISALDIISYDTRPLDTAPQIAVTEGPSFAERLSRAEENRTRENPGLTEAENRTKESLPAAEYRKDDKKTRQPASSESDHGNESVDQKTAAASSPGKETEKKAEKKSESVGNTEPAVKSRHGMDTEASRKKQKPGLGEEIMKSTANSGSRTEGSKLEESDALILDQEAVAAAETEDSAAEAVNDLSASVSKDNVRHDEESGSAEQQSATAAELIRSGGEADNATVAKKIREEQTRSSGKGRRAEAVSTSEGKRSDTPRIEVRDLRENRVAAHTRTDASDNKAEAQPASFSLSPGGETEQTHRQEVMVLETRSTGGDGTQPRPEALPSRAAGELAKALREGGNNEILKRAQFLLKDNNQGEIRLILKPERLGEVRIRLNLNDRHIAGRIIVENNSVREVFQENIEALNRTFRENGFQTAGLDVSVGDSENGDGERRGRMESRGNTSRLAELLDEQVPRADADIYPMSTVNVYV